MPSREELKQLVFQEIDSRADEIVNISKTILANPEPGFREVKTAQLVAGKFAEMGIPERPLIIMRQNPCPISGLAIRAEERIQYISARVRSRDRKAV